MAKKLDIYFQDGHKSYPLCVFMHGLGMNRNVWVMPEKSRVLAGRAPIDVMMSDSIEEKTVHSKEKIKIKTITTGKRKGELRTLFHDLSELKYPCITWSQRRPANSISFALDELKEIMGFYKDYTKNGVIMIGHSRGGLIARKFIETTKNNIIGLVTLSAPHKGSSMAKLADILSKFTSYLSPYFENSEKGTLNSTINRFISFLECEAMKEVLPDSTFVSSLKNKIDKNIHSLSMGGTKPTLITLYRAKVIKKKEYKVVEYKKIFSLPDIFRSFLPEKLTPLEIEMGSGDGLVSEKSSKIPYADVHNHFHLNHVEILFHHDVRRKIIGFLQRL